MRKNTWLDELFGEDPDEEREEETEEAFYAYQILREEEEAEEAQVWEDPGSLF